MKIAEATLWILFGALLLSIANIFQDSTGISQTMWRVLAVGGAMCIIVVPMYVLSEWLPRFEVAGIVAEFFMAYFIGLAALIILPPIIEALTPTGNRLLDVVFDTVVVRFLDIAFVALLVGAPMAATIYLMRRRY